MRISIRPFRPEDLGRIVELWDHAGVFAKEAEGLQEAVDLFNSGEAVVLVAEADGEMVGAASGVVSASLGLIHALAARSGSDEEAVAAPLLDRMEAELSERGARKVVAAVPKDTGLGRLLEDRGYRDPESLIHLERAIPPTVSGPTALAELGAVVIDPGLWERLKGMEEAKRIIERRVILPLSEPELAARHSVQPPKAIVLFGPPGTGKTTFAKGIASRLGWPFIEIEPSELLESGEHEARLLAQTFDRILELPSALVFVDEVEDIASVRHETRRVSARVTNEFLKQISKFREAQHHLLVCATNWVGRLDPAFLRPGRFDYVLPVGPPDGKARASIWKRYVEEITDEEVDVDALVAATRFFTPADIEFAARKAAQGAFEQEHFDERRRRATTEDFIAAVEATKPTLSDEVLSTFGKDVETFARD